jgi:hypothetical protein
MDELLNAAQEYQLQMILSSFSAFEIWYSKLENKLKTINIDADSVKKDAIESDLVYGRWTVVMQRQLITDEIRKHELKLKSLAVQACPEKERFVRGQLRLLEIILARNISGV